MRPTTGDRGGGRASSARRHCPIRRSDRPLARPTSRPPGFSTSPASSRNLSRISDLGERLLKVAAVAVAGMRRCCGRRSASRSRAPAAGAAPTALIAGSSVIVHAVTQRGDDRIVQRRYRRARRNRRRRAPPSPRRHAAANISRRNNSADRGCASPRRTVGRDVDALDLLGARPQFGQAPPAGNRAPDGSGCSRRRGGNSCG